MWTSAIVKGQIPTDPGAGFGHGLVGMEIELFIFDRPPEPLDEDIVPPCAFAVHRDGALRLLQHGGEIDGGKLRSLVRIDDIGFAVSSKRLFDGFDAEGCLHRDRQPPRQNLRLNQPTTAQR